MAWKVDWYIWSKKQRTSYHSSSVIGDAVTGACFSWSSFDLNLDQENIITFSWSRSRPWKNSNIFLIERPKFSTKKNKQYFFHRTWWPALSWTAFHVFFKIEYLFTLIWLGLLLLAYALLVSILRHVSDSGYVWTLQNHDRKPLVW